MFSWKRPRKEEASAPPVGCCATAPGLEHASPSAVVDAAYGQEPSSSCSSSEDEGIVPVTPSAHSVADGCGGSRRSIELSALAGAQLLQLGAAPAAGQAQQQQQQQQLQPRSTSVRAKAAFFEALIHCNSTTHIQCSVDSGASCSSHAATHGWHSSGTGGDGSGDGGMQLAARTPGVIELGAVDDGCAEFSEVHMVLRMPRAAPGPAPPGGGKYGSVSEMEALIEQLQGALAVKDRQLKTTLDAYQRRTSEVENLCGVVRELTESRSKVVGQRASLAERYADLQQEYHRMLRIADLSRTVSKENLAKTSRTRSELRQIQKELHATKRDAQHLSEKHKKVRLENALLKEKVTLLERLNFDDVQESECKRHFTRYRLAETY